MARLEDPCRLYKPNPSLFRKGKKGLRIGWLARDPIIWLVKDPRVQSTSLASGHCCLSLLSWGWPQARPAHWTCTNLACVWKARKHVWEGQLLTYVGTWVSALLTPLPPPDKEPIYKAKLIQSWKPWNDQGFLGEDNVAALTQSGKRHRSVKVKCRAYYSWDSISRDCANSKVGPISTWNGIAIISSYAKQFLKIPEIRKHISMCKSLPLSLLRPGCWRPCPQLPHPFSTARQRDLSSS